MNKGQVSMSNFINSKPAIHIFSRFIYILVLVPAVNYFMYIIKVIVQMFTPVINVSFDIFHLYYCHKFNYDDLCC